jgi:hypothetical protein
LPSAVPGLGKKAPVAGPFPESSKNIPVNLIIYRETANYGRWYASCIAMTVGG